MQEQTHYCNGPAAIDHQTSLVGQDWMSAAIGELKAHFHLSLLILHSRKTL